MPGSGARPRVRDVLGGFPRPVPGRTGDPGLFGPGSLVWRVNSEAVTLLGGGRALLMQIAHPMVAAGVTDHSDLETDPFGRLWRTLDTVLTVAFGDTAQAKAAGKRVADKHARVVGQRDGSSYRALDAELLLWVHATLVDTALVTYELFVGDLTAAGREGYYQEMKRFADVFGLPEADLPADLTAFREYVDRAVTGMEVSAEARRLAPEILRPPGPLSLAPVSSLMRFVTVGLLPPELREGFGLGWGSARERGFETLSVAIRGIRAVLPRRSRLWPHAVQAEGRSVANVR